VALYRLPVNRFELGLGVEKNFQRYRRHANPCAFGLIPAFDGITAIASLTTIVRESDLNVTYSALERSPLPRKR